MKNILLSICLLWAIGAQSQDIHPPAENNQISAIAEQQKEILSGLNDIKQILAAMIRPAQPPSPPSLLATNDEAFRGDGGATVAIIEYADFECPYCGQYEHDIYPQIARDYIETGKVRYFFRDLPLPMHPRAMGAARAARCAGEQGKFWEMHDSLFAKQNAIRDVDMPGRAQELGLDKTTFADCLSSERYADEIKQSADNAQKMGVEGTPTFFIGKLNENGTVTDLKMIVGTHPYNEFKTVLDSLAGKAAQP
jgi:protein-disulfide isomerase